MCRKGSLSRAQCLEMAFSASPLGLLSIIEIMPFICVDLRIYSASVHLFLHLIFTLTSWNWPNGRYYSHFANQEMMPKESIRITDFYGVFIMALSSKIVTLSNIWTGCSFLSLVNGIPFMCLLGSVAAALWDFMSSTWRMLQDPQMKGTPVSIYYESSRASCVPAPLLMKLPSCRLLGFTWSLY